MNEPTPTPIQTSEGFQSSAATIQSPRSGTFAPPEGLGTRFTSPAPMKIATRPNTASGRLSCAAHTVPIRYSRTPITSPARALRGNSLKGSAIR